ncbi:hypothetical protein CR513_57299, partial [Mucuna pruriens]
MSLSLEGLLLGELFIWLGECPLSRFLLKMDFWKTRTFAGWGPFSLGESSITHEHDEDLLDL